MMIGFRHTCYFKKRSETERVMEDFTDSVEHHTEPFVTQFSLESNVENGFEQIDDILFEVGPTMESDNNSNAIDFNGLCNRLFGDLMVENEENGNNPNVNAVEIPFDPNLEPFAANAVPLDVQYPEPEVEGNPEDGGGYGMYDFHQFKQSVEQDHSFELAFIDSTNILDFFFAYIPVSYLARIQYFTNLNAYEHNMNSHVFITDGNIRVFIGITSRKTASVLIF